MKLVCCSLILLWAAVIHGNPVEPAAEEAATSEEAAKAFMTDAEEQMRSSSEKLNYLVWDRDVNINKETQDKVDAQAVSVRDINLKLAHEASKFDASKITDVDLARKIKWVRDQGVSALPEEKQKRYAEIITEIEKIYASASVPSIGDPNVMLTLNPALVNIFAQSKDPKELEQYWNSWREATGAKIRGLYKEYVALINEAAVANGFKDGTELKTYAFESETFPDQIKEAWSKLKPLYEQIHAYVRSKLIDRYTDAVVKPTAPIPAHLLGNMWGNSWDYLSDVLVPFPEKKPISPTPHMISKGYTPKLMYDKVQEYFVSLGFDPLPKEVLEKSFLELPSPDANVNCKAAAWDFYNGKDFRVKQCTQVDAGNFLTAFHEVAALYNYMLYSNQSFLFRNGASPGYKEALADSIILATGTPTFFKTLGLIDETVNLDDEEQNTNILFGLALQDLVFMPLGHLVDQYRWDLYSGKVPLDNMNCHWVKMLADIQGVAPPSKRNEAQFDAGARESIASDDNYSRYFVSHIYKFAFFRELCKAAGQYVPGDASKPLHKCNIAGNKEAGNLLKGQMQLGRSKNWQDALKVMGINGLDASAMVEYFAPLEAWLKKYNDDHKNNVGWKVDNYEELCSA